MSGKGAISEMPIVRFLLVEGIGSHVIQASKPEPRIMRYELTDFEWTAIRSLLPNKPRGIPRVDDRRVLNGIFWVLRSGAPWRDLPEPYGTRTTCYNRFVRCGRQCRRVATRYDKLAANDLAFVKLASIRICYVPMGPRPSRQSLIRTFALAAR
jgi:transposase